MVSIVCTGTVQRPRAPAVGLLGVVAPLADALAVAGAGRAALGRILGVVEVADRRVAPRVAATLVAKAEEVGQPALEPPAVLVHGDQLAGRGLLVEAAHPVLDALLGVVGDPLPQQVAGHGAVAVDVAAAVAVAEQHGVGDHDVDDQWQLGEAGACPRCGERGRGAPACRP